MNQELITPAVVPAPEQVLMALFAVLPIPAMALAPGIQARNAQMKAAVLTTVAVPAQLASIVPGPTSAPYPIPAAALLVVPAMNQELITPAVVPAPEQVLMALFAVLPIPAMALAPGIQARNAQMKAAVLTTVAVPAQALRNVQGVAA
ncbi:unnamed protein product [marine sediment metagenome]|uniref:Uncharacterized protein n=1 Tax=marine sediment metagenome TaxID=412755 RepID=X1NUJ4_9ZZZZ